MLKRNGPVVKSVESVLRLEGSLWGKRFVEEAQCTKPNFNPKFHQLLFGPLPISQIS